MHNRLMPRQAKFVAALLAGQKVEQAGRTAGVWRRTATAWIGLPAVRRAIEDGLADLLREAGLAAMAATGEALAALRAILADSETTAHARIAAARAILELAVRLYEAVDLEARLRRLEEIMEVKNVTETAP